MEITLKFDVNEVNTILAVLAEAPYKVSEPLINKIKEQAEPQVNATQATVANSN
jgi:16S rRNA A1518/A1519 N6-dimethyltransferase RsmA/KsgA/DIM1 with predicted DNA glycosylase/AP lyase activity